MDFEIIVFPINHDGGAEDAIAKIEATTIEVGMLMVGQRLEEWIKEQSIDTLKQIHRFDIQVIYGE